MKQTVRIALSVVLGFFTVINFGCSPKEGKRLTKEELKARVHIIPQPADLKVKRGTFNITPGTRIITDTGNPKMNDIARRLAHKVNTATGFNLNVSGFSGVSEPYTNGIVFKLDPSADLDTEEGYLLSANDNRVMVTAKTPQGAFYGYQTIRQLLPPEVESKEIVNNVDWFIPAVEIKDQPRYTYRGMHLDVGRHFFPVDFIKKYIDLIAMHKMNTFHWHLTEDQGWRIEIKKYPKLTEIGAYRDSTLVGHYGDKPQKYDGKRYGGFYTQDQIRDVVKYAQERYVTIIPEIEMPGHSVAALAAYPELACTDGPFHVATIWGVHKDIYCPKEKTFEFLEDVLTEVMDLFPSKYIHIGGDEAPKDRWEESEVAQQVMKREGLKNEEELQSYFIKRMEKFLNAHGREIIGWDEILQGGLAPGATVMSWRGTEGGIEAAKQNHDVIMTPGNWCYFDHYQADPETEPLAIGGFTTVKQVYNYEPTPKVLNKQQAKHILGAQGNVWTEYMKTGDKVEYMAYPRAVALAEVDWTPKKKKDWKDFMNRLQPEFKRLKLLDVNYAPHYEHGHEMPKAAK